MVKLGNREYDYLKVYRKVVSGLRKIPYTKPLVKMVMNCFLEQEIITNKCGMIIKHQMKNT